MAKEFLSEAFKKLNILGEDIFNVDDDGIKDLREFEKASEEEENTSISVIDPEAETDERVEYDILQIGTGWDFSQDELDNMEFIGTVKEGPYICHIFVNQLDKFKEKEKTYDEYNEESNYDHVNMTVNFGGMALG